MFQDKKILKSFLNSRGIASVESLKVEEKDIPSGLELDHAQLFIDQVVQDLKDGKRITVVGDYDADGICGTTVALRGLRIAAEALGVRPFVNYIIPHRFDDGYGLSSGVIDKVLRQNPKTGSIITVDNGTVANEAVAYAKMKGLKVYITDHHQGLLDAPNADAHVNPNKVGDTYPFKGICGTAVIYKLLREMSIQYFPESLDQIDSLVDFVGVATVADMMPVLEENRYYISESLNIFNGDSDYPLRFAWLAMIEYLTKINKVSRDQIFNEKDYGFTFGPVLNAQSRVEGIADIAVDLFESKDTTDIREKVEYMVSINERRKKLSNEAFDRIDKDSYNNQSAIVVRDDSVGEGFIGLVAGKIAQHFDRPAVVFTKSKKGLKGSARSVEGVNLLELLRNIDQDIYVNVGGHSAAAGMTIHEDRFDDFVSQLNHEASLVIDPDRIWTPHFDFIVKNINEEDIDSINSLAPYGIGFERPVLRMEDMEINDIQLMGKENQHIKIKTDNNVDIIVWNANESLIDQAKKSNTVSMTGQPEINEFMGLKSIQVVVDERELELS